MKMIMIVFRSSLEADLLAVLERLGVNAFSRVPEVHGIGASGEALHAFPSPAFNSMILAALEDREAERVAQALRAFRDQGAALQQGAHIPLRVFLLPCIQAV
jgi:nitrogen regulatory protein PII